MEKFITVVIDCLRTIGYFFFPFLEVTMITKHAQIRLQQRAIPELAVEMFERFGSRIRHNGADILFFDKAARKRLAKAFGGQRASRVLEPWLNSYVCIEGGTVITAAHRIRRLKRDH